VRREGWRRGGGGGGVVGMVWWGLWSGEAGVCVRGLFWWAGGGESVGVVWYLGRGLLGGVSCCGGGGGCLWGWAWGLSGFPPKLAGGKKVVQDSDPDGRLARVRGGT